MTPSLAFAPAPRGAKRAIHPIPVVLMSISTLLHVMWLSYNVHKKDVIWAAYNVPLCKRPDRATMDQIEHDFIVLWKAMREINDSLKIKNRLLRLDKRTTVQEAGDMALAVNFNAGEALEAYANYFVPQLMAVLAEKVAWQ
jgi:hypothetical protein